ncbi:hypothetical protein ABZP36_007964 [Zizania latifolia]
MERRNPQGMDDPYVRAIIRVARVFDMGPGRTLAWGFVLALGLRELQERKLGGVGPVGQALRFLWGSEETTGKSLLRSMYDVALVFVIFAGPVMRTHGLPKIRMWAMAAWMWGARAWWKLRYAARVQDSRSRHASAEGAAAVLDSDRSKPSSWSMVITEAGLAGGAPVDDVADSQYAENRFILQATAPAPTPPSGDRAACLPRKGGASESRNHGAQESPGQGPPYVLAIIRVAWGVFYLGMRELHERMLGGVGPLDSDVGDGGADVRGEGVVEAAECKTAHGVPLCVEGAAAVVDSDRSKPSSWSSRRPVWPEGHPSMT